MSQSEKKTSRVPRILGFAILMSLAFVLGKWTSLPPPSPLQEKGTDLSGEHPGSDSSKVAEPTVKWWTCSMHPSVKLPSGDMKCPICFMDLIPVEEGEEEGDLPILRLGQRARLLAEVETAPVETKAVTKTLRLVGKIKPDETRLSVITAWVPGRLDRLFVDYTGMEVRKGDHLVRLYSPELYSAQQELLQAIASFGEMGESKSTLLKTSSQSLIQSSREKLVRLGLSQEQVDGIVQLGQPTDTITLYSPTSGIVIARQGTEGMYVSEGSMIYTIADLSQVWLILDAYESDLAWLHYGQRVRFESEAYPGEVFEGTLSFISPVLDEPSRTVKLRVNVGNSDRRLKPGMFVRASIQAIPAAGGKVMAPELAGKWICPMHPEIVEDLFGRCPVCGMALETADSLGYVVAPSGASLPLVVPETAPLLTGERAVVYVERQAEDGLTYEGRTVELGAHADGYYVVASGLLAGENVVTRGNFKLDSALQIQGKPSLMNPLPGASTPGAGESSGVVTEKGREEFDLPAELQSRSRDLVTFYLGIQEALAGDSFEDARREASKLTATVESLPPAESGWEGLEVWREILSRLGQSVKVLGSEDHIEAFRKAFYPVSETMHDFLLRFGNRSEIGLQWTFCPMALDRGAYWIQSGTAVANPYYGASMLRCGEFKESFPVTARAGE